MTLLAEIKKRAKAVRRHLVFPEGEETRTIEAVGIIASEGLADVTLLGNRSAILSLIERENIAPDSVSIITPDQSKKLDEYADIYKQKRAEKAGKQIDSNSARQTMADPLYYGAMMVAQGDADASVAGAIHTSGDVLRSAVRVVGLKKGLHVASSCFLMTLPSSQKRNGDEQCYLFADCAIIPNPDADQLVSITLATAETWSCLTGTEARVALLSFSTKGSANHPDVDKVLTALEILQRNHPDLVVDGELQVDAAIISEIAERKAPGSPVAGNANVLIFPDLDAGNIGYKLVERLAGASATGPLIQGLSKPIYDLSRGCSPQDIVDVAMIANVMAENV